MCCFFPSTYGEEVFLSLSTRCVVVPDVDSLRRCHQRLMWMVPPLPNGDELNRMWIRVLVLVEEQLEKACAYMIIMY